MKIKNLKRSVALTEGGFQLKTELQPSLQYALYLHTPEKLHKRYYKSEGEWVFSENVVLGKFYTADFYYKCGSDIEKHRLVFYVDKLSKEVVVIEGCSIVETSDYKIDYYNRGSDITFVVFNGYGSTKNSEPFGLNFLLGLGFNVVACLQNNNQYQGLSFTDFKDYVGSYVVNKRVFLYGSSLGGYCAVYYAGAVNGTVIAAAPKNSAHPGLVKNEKFKNLKFTHSEIFDNPITDKPVFILIDNLYKSDVNFIEKFVLPAYPNLYLLPFKNAGHAVLYHVNKTKQLKNIILNIVYNKPIVIDSGIESVYTDLTQARNFLSKKMYADFELYVEKILSSNDLNDNILNQVKDMVDKSRNI